MRKNKKRKEKRNLRKSNQKQKIPKNVFYKWERAKQRKRKGFLLSEQLPLLVLVKKFPLLKFGGKVFTLKTLIQLSDNFLWAEKRNGKGTQVYALELLEGLPKQKDY